MYRDCTADVYYYTQENKDILTVCGELALANSQIPTQPLLPSLSSAWQGEKIGWERTCVDIKTGRLLTNYPHRQNRLDLRKINIIYWQLQYILVGRNKGKRNNNTFLSPLPRINFTPSLPTPLPTERTPGAPRWQHLDICTQYAIISLPEQLFELFSYFYSSQSKNV